MGIPDWGTRMTGRKEAIRRFAWPILPLARGHAGHRQSPVRVDAVHDRPDQESECPLDAVQWALTFFVIAQTGLFPISAYLVDRVGPRIVVALASVLVGAGWIGAGFAKSIPRPLCVLWHRGLGAGAVYSACVGVAMKWFPDRRGLCVGLVAGSTDLAPL